MNDKSKTEKTAFGMSKEEFIQRLEEQERLDEEPFEYKALEKFVRKPTESNFYGKTEKTAFGMSKEEFIQRLEEQERLDEEPFEYKALENL